MEISFYENAETRLAVGRMENDWNTICQSLGNDSLVAEAMARFTSEKRRKEWLSVRMLLAQIDARPQPIAYYPTGRPYLTSGDWHISISHTQGYVAVMLGKRPVAVDIEQYGMRVHKVRDRFVRPDEVISSFRGDDTWSLLLHWSAKETIYKRLDDPAVDGLLDIQILPFTLQDSGQMHVKVHNRPVLCEYVVHYALHPQYVLTWEEG